MFRGAAMGDGRPRTPASVVPVLLAAALVCLVWSAWQGRLERPVGESGSWKRRGLVGLRPRAAPR